MERGVGFVGIVGNPSGVDHSGFRLYADAVVDGGRISLGAAQIALGRLYRDVAEQKLDLLQLAASGTTDRMPVTALSVGTRKAVEDGRLRYLEIRQSQDRLRSDKFSLASNLRFMTSGLQSPLVADRQMLNLLGPCSALSARSISPSIAHLTFETAASRRGSLYPARHCREKNQSH